MKKYFTIITSLCFILIISNCMKKQQQIPEISYGTMSENWNYTNESLKFSLQLPSDWNFLAGSDVIKMTGSAPKSIFPTTKFKITKTLDFQDESSIYPLFSITENTEEEMRSGNRKVRISFVVTSSPENNAKDDLEKIKANFSEKLPKNLKIEEKEIPFGTEKLPAIDLQMPDSAGTSVGNRLYAVKNYDGYNLIIIIDYFNSDEFNQALKVLGSVKKMN